MSRAETQRGRTTQPRRWRLPAAMVNQPPSDTRGRLSMESDQRNGGFKMQSRMPCVVVGMASLLLSRLAGAQDYQWTEIVIQGTRVVQAWQINDRGQVAIGLTTDGRTGIYQNGAFSPLPPLPQGFQGATALGINNDGVITGGATDASGTRQGFILCGETYTFFSRPDWENTAGRAIADSGLITGQSFNADGRNAGFIYDSHTRTFTDATPPGSTDTITHGINNFGRITGHGVESGIGRYGFVWQQGTIIKGKRKLLPFLDRLKIGAAGAATRGINDSGVVVGFTSNPDGTSDSFVGNEALGYQRLVPPGGEVPGNSTFCEGINNSAQVECYVWDSASNPQGAFIGSPSADEGNADSSSHAASTRDIAASSGAAGWTNKSREELVIPTIRP